MTHTAAGSRAPCSTKAQSVLGEASCRYHCSRVPGKVPFFFRCRRACANVKKPGRKQGQVPAGSAEGSWALEA